MRFLPEGMRHEEVVAPFPLKGSRLQGTSFPVNACGALNMLVNERH